MQHRQSSRPVDHTRRMVNPEVTEAAYTYARGRNKACNCRKNAEARLRTALLHGAVASISCFVLLSMSTPGHPTGIGRGNFLFSSWSLRGNEDHRVVPRCSVFSCYLQGSAAPS